MHFAHKILFAQNTINKLISQKVNHFLLFSDFSLTYILTFNYSLISTTTTPCNPILSKLTKNKLENMNIVRSGSQTAASKEVSLGIFALGGQGYQRKQSQLFTESSKCPSSSSLLPSSFGQVRTISHISIYFTVQSPTIDLTKGPQGHGVSLLFIYLKIKKWPDAILQISSVDMIKRCFNSL